MDNYELEENKFREKFSNIKISFLKLLKRFSGFDVGEDGKQYRRSDPLLSEELITKAGVSLEPYMNESMLISKKEPHAWYRQRLNTAFTFLRVCLTDMGCPHENMGLCFESYYNTLKNTGDVFLHSRDLTNNVFKGKDEEIVKTEVL